MSSRFNKYFEFPDYNGTELTAIFTSFCKKNGYTIAEREEQLLLDHFTAIYENRDENFGNARTVRNIFEKAISRQADRIAGQTNVSPQELERLLYEDIVEAFRESD